MAKDMKRLKEDILKSLNIQFEHQKQNDLLYKTVLVSGNVKYIFFKNTIENHTAILDFLFKNIYNSIIFKLSRFEDITLG